MKISIFGLAVLCGALLKPDSSQAQSGLTRQKIMSLILQAQLNDYKKHFSAAGEWLGTVPSPPVQRLDQMALMGHDLRLITLGSLAQYEDCAKICIEEIECRAFSFFPGTPESEEGGTCQLKGERGTSQADSRAISGTVPARSNLN